MSERKAITLVMIAVVLVTMTACVTVLLLGGGTELASATTLIVGCLGVDRMSKFIMDFDSADRR